MNSYSLLIVVSIVTMGFHGFILVGFFFTSACAVVNKEAKRREATPSYGPPNRPNSAFPTQSIHNGFGNIPNYSAPPQDKPPTLPIPHQEYRIPQNMPHREYGVPVLKYGPPKVNLEYGVPPKNSLYDEVKSHFGLPKPIYGIPQIPPRPNSFIIQQNYGSPLQTYNPPTQQYMPPSTNYRSPLKSKYGVPSPPYPKYGTPIAASQNIASSYGSPPLLTPPPLHYGLPLSATYDQHSSFTSYGTAEREGESSYHNGVATLPEKQLQIIESNVDTSLQLPTISCDGWRPIPSPAGRLISQSKEHTPFVLSDDQLIAVALQAGFGDSVQQLPSTIAIKDVHSYGDGHNLDVLQSESIKINNKNLQDTYSSPPADSYAPSSYHALKHSGSEQNFNIGLVPPNEVYGVPNKGLEYSTASAHGGSHHSNHLGIQYGTVSGNLKPWLSNGTPPKKPIAFRPPVPQGLLESIGASVQHLDQYGVRPPVETNTYIPPTPTETPQHHHEEDHHLSSFASENVQYTQSLPLIQEPRFNQAQDCGFGPNLNSGVTSHLNQETSDFKSNKISDYGQSEASLESNVASDFEGNIINSDFYYSESSKDSYGPPPSGDPVGYESKQAAVSASQESFTGGNSYDATPDELPGLHNINVISAKKSHSVTIPVRGQLGTYQLQFQSANPIDSSSKNPTQADHEQILSQGLLQTILSAIEQPQLETNNQKDLNEDHHKEVDEFFNSPEGKQALSDKEI